MVARDAGKLVQTMDGRNLGSDSRNAIVPMGYPVFASQKVGSKFYNELQVLMFHHIVCRRIRGEDAHGKTNQERYHCWQS